MDAISILQVKRNDLRPHSKEELEWWIGEYSKGNIPDYQMSAWLMATCWRGMNAEETATLTKCMVLSGKRLSWDHQEKQLPNLVDKHSTGGVGDKISLILAPLVASLGVHVPMMAGRGLGHTGGTIDKLESIPGYRTSLSIDEFQQIVQEVGCSIVSASSEMCLADQKLYALRDVTATVSSIPLQTSSIMCKKIAENPHSLVLDVKYGRASFQSNVSDAAELARSMISTGEANGLQPTTCFLTHMDSIIGHCAGNWLEVQESLELLLNGKGSHDLVSLVVIEAAQMLQQSKKYHQVPLDELAELAHSTLVQGKAYPYFEKMVQAHGGDVSSYINQDGTVKCPHPQPKYVKTICATKSGYVSKLDGLLIGTLCVQLGAGRQIAGQAVDPMAGIQLNVNVGDCVEEKTTILAKVQTNHSKDILEQVCTTLQNSVEYSDASVQVPFVVSHKVTSHDGLEEFTIPSCLQRQEKKE